MRSAQRNSLKIAFRFAIAFLTVPLLAPIVFTLYNAFFYKGFDAPGHLHTFTWADLPESLLAGLALWGLPNYVAFGLFGSAFLFVLWRLKWTSFLAFALVGMFCAAFMSCIITHASLTPAMACFALVWPGSLGFFEGLATRFIVFGSKDTFEAG